MMQYFKTFHGLVGLVVCLLSSSFGCTIKATLDHYGWHHRISVFHLGEILVDGRGPRQRW